MTGIPAALAERTADDEHPATADLSAPVPDDIGAAVAVLWSKVAELERLVRAHVQRM